MGRKTHNRLLLHAAAMGAIAAAWTEPANAGVTTLGPAEDVASPVKVELIDGSRLGCSQSGMLWAKGPGGTQCAFDIATHGASLTATQDLAAGTLETYATVARSMTGAFTPDQLLSAPGQRANVSTDLFAFGLKGSAFEGRLKVTADFARTERVAGQLLDRGWALAERNHEDGTMFNARVDAVLTNRPGLKWSLTGEYRSASDEFSVGRSSQLFRYFALPGSRLALSSKARIGNLGLNAGLEQIRSSLGQSSTQKAGVDFNGISLRLRSRKSSAVPIEGSIVLDSRTQTNGVVLDLDPEQIAGWLLADLSDLPVVVPSSISLSYRTGETESRYQGSIVRYGRSSLGIDTSWDTALGDTTFNYWRDFRTGRTDGARSRSSEMVQVSHSMRRGNWRFGADASLSHSRSESGFADRSLSFGQSIAYSAPDGPEFRLQLGQDRGQMWTRDESYLSSDNYSSVTASLDLSRYLQKRFERPDLRLTLDYRRALDHSESEMSFDDELIDRWVDGNRREGFLFSFGMKL